MPNVVLRNPVTGQPEYGPNNGSTPANYTPPAYVPQPVAAPAVQVRSTAAPSIQPPTQNLQPGMTGTAVKQLQDWLVANGLMTQAAVNTGYGTYGPQTTAAVQKVQQMLGVNNSSGPGYWGPLTVAAVQKAIPSSAPATSAPATGSTIGYNLTPTGNPELDAALKSLSETANGLVTSGYTIPPNLQITPELVGQFLAMAHKVVDPMTQQTLNSEIVNINADLKNQQLQYNNSVGGRVQQFGSDLATEQNNAGNNGIAFSGMRNLNELNMVNSANRDISSLASTAAFNAGNTLRTGASAVGSANANAFTLPDIAGGSVTNAGGSRGAFNAGPSMALDYNPSLYTVGTIPSGGNKDVQNQAKNYEDQYQVLASNSSASGRSVSDLLGSLSGLPGSAGAGPSPTVGSAPLSSGTPSTGGTTGYKAPPSSSSPTLIADLAPYDAAKAAALFAKANSTYSAADSAAYGDYIAPYNLDASGKPRNNGAVLT